MDLLGLVELQRPRQRQEHAVGGLADVAALELRVGGHADPGEAGDLLTTKPGTRRTSSSESHAIEAFMAVREPDPGPELVLGRPQVGGNRLSDDLALTSVRHLARHLVRAVEHGDDLEARAGMLYGSLTAGMAFGNAGGSAAHALPFAIGAATHTSHGLGTGLMLPYVMEYDRPVREAALAELALALAAGLDEPTDPPRDAVDVVFELGQAIGLPGSLADLGLVREHLPRLAEEAVVSKRLIDNGPRPLDADGLEQVLDAAWHGDPARLRAAAV